MFVQAPSPKNWPTYELTATLCFQKGEQPEVAKSHKQHLSTCCPSLPRFETAGLCLLGQATFLCILVVIPTIIDSWVPLTSFAVYLCFLLICHYFGL